MARQRLLVFTENYARGGGNRYCVDLINALAGSYHEIVLAANDGAIFPEDRERLPANVRVEAVGFITRSRARHALRRLPKLARAPWLLLLSLAEPLVFRSNVRRFARYLGGQDPDLVLGCNGGYPAARATLAMMLAAHRRGIPAAMSVVSMPTPRRASMRAYDKSIDRRVWKSLRLVIVNAQTIADALGTQHEMPPRLAQVVYNGLPDVPYHPNRTTELQIGFVARLDKAKGVLVLLDAFNQLLKKWPDLRLRLVGQGDASAAITARVRVLGIGNRVETTGFAEGDISALLESFRVYAFPSLHEGLPYSILEAMRAGCTIVSTSVGGIPEVMRDAREGLLVSAGDATALAGALGRLLSEPETAARYGRAARERFERNYLLENFYVATLDAFRNAELLRSEGTADER